MKLIKHFDLTAICGRKRPPISERLMGKWTQNFKLPIDRREHQRQLKFINISRLNIALSREKESCDIIILKI